MTAPGVGLNDETARPFEVVISGAGLAGGSLALRLARDGVRVALLDAGVFPRDKLCGEFLSPECWGVLDRLDLSGSVERLGYHPVTRFRLTTPQGRRLEAEFAGPDGLPGIALSRLGLDDLIVRKAREAGAVVVEGVRVKGPVVRDGRVAGVVARRGADPSFEVIADVTVAAEGRHSPLVQRTGTTRPRSRFRPGLFGMKRHLRVVDREAEPAGTVGLHLVPGGYVGTCRVESGLTNLCGLLPESTLRSYRGDLERLAGGVFAANPFLDGLWRGGEPAGAWKTVSGVRVEASRPTLPGVLYAGDCQGTVDPLGGQGMTMALLGAEMLADFATRAAAGGGPVRDFSETT